LVFMDKVASLHLCERIAELGGRIVVWRKIHALLGFAFVDRAQRGKMQYPLIFNKRKEMRDMGGSGDSAEEGAKAQFFLKGNGVRRNGAIRKIRREHMGDILRRAFQAGLEVCGNDAIKAQSHADDEYDKKANARDAALQKNVSRIWRLKSPGVFLGGRPFCRFL